MNILIVNGSPKGENSITYHTAKYLEALYGKHHEFRTIHPGQKIKAMEKDFTKAKELLSWSNLIIFTYPVYTFIAPSQLHRFIELVKESDINLDKKYSTQITTSKHFFDTTAHNFIEENCLDMGLRVIPGISADMDDLLTEKGQKEARDFFKWTVYSINNDIYKYTGVKKEINKHKEYQCQIQKVEKTKNYTVAIVTDASAETKYMENMVKDLENALPCNVKVAKLKDFPFQGGCLGCFECAFSGKCIYKDNFDKYLREEIQSADGIIYAFTIKNHYADSIMKTYDDRQFCNGHRTVTTGMPAGYLISGDYEKEPNLRAIIEGRSSVGGNFLIGPFTDQENTAENIKKLADAFIYALDKKIEKPKNFYGVGGMKIFRDLIYTMQGLMKEDHKFYKKHGIYDFPQNNKATILKMKLVGLMVNNKTLKKKMKGQANKFMVKPYQDVIDKAKR